MALVLSGERPRAAAVSANPVRSVLTWIGKVRVAWAQQQALQDLLDLDAHRLDDLGINRSDLLDALHTQHRSTRLLAARRARRLGDHLNP